MHIRIDFIDVGEFLVAHEDVALVFQVIIGEHGCGSCTWSAHVVREEGYRPGVLPGRMVSFA